MKHLLGLLAMYLGKYESTGREAVLFRTRANSHALTRTMPDTAISGGIHDLYKPEVFHFARSRLSTLLDNI